VGVNGEGLVDPSAVGAALTDHTVLVTIMHSNNEVRHFMIHHPRVLHS
jgi:cysteine desulfurase